MTSALDTVGKLPDPVAKRGINEAQWRTLCNSLYPGANPQSVLMVVDYCRARSLDPLKRPCHIVPMEVKDARTGAYLWRDVILPGIYEYRTTAMRTGVSLGHSRPEFGPAATCYGVAAPEYCEMTMYRWNATANVRVEYPVRVYFREVVAVTKDKGSKDWTANSRWRRAPIQMLTKCTEAAGLREAFPDELGGTHTAEEMDGQRAVDVVIDDEATAQPAPAGFEDWWTDLQATAQERDIRKLEAAYAASAEPLRQYVANSLAFRLGWEALKRQAQEGPAPDPIEGETE